MRGTVFYKMSGSGNDFVVLDGRFTRAELWPADQIRAVCDRRTGVGADGLVILTPAAVETVRMQYWNSDGSHGALCGNAALCCSRLAVQLEMVLSNEFCLQTDAGAVRVRSLDEGEEAEINLPDFDAPEAFEEAKLKAGERWMARVTVGVPHLVIRVDDVEAADVAQRGRELRSHPRLGSGGANVNFVSPQGTQAPWLIRTYERGVEGETLACGTGTIAAGVALAAKGEAALPVRFRSRGGPELTAKADLTRSIITGVWLGGQGRLLFRGVWEAI